MIHTLRIVYLNLSRSQTTSRGGSHAAETRAWEPNGTNFCGPLTGEAVANYTWFDKLTTGFKV
jgi:hypothetical protein